MFAHIRKTLKISQTLTRWKLIFLKALVRALTSQLLVRRERACVTREQVRHLPLGDLRVQRQVAAPQNLQPDPFPGNNFLKSLHNYENHFSDCFKKYNSISLFLCLFTEHARGTGRSAFIKINEFCWCDVTLNLIIANRKSLSQQPNRLAMHRQCVFVKQFSFS